MFTDGPRSLVYFHIIRHIYISRDKTSLKYSVDNLLILSDSTSVLILDGKSEISAHVLSEIGNLIMSL